MVSQTPSAEAERAPVSPRVQAVRIGCVAAGSIAAAYVWALLIEHGLHSLVVGSALDNAPNFPGANAALVAAIVAYVGAPIVAWWYGDLWLGNLRWFLVTAAAGLALFGLAAVVLQSGDGSLGWATVPE
jgi:hypothetical protein